MAWAEVKEIKALSCQAVTLICRAVTLSWNVHEQILMQSARPSNTDPRYAQGASTHTFWNLPSNSLLEYFNQGLICVFHNSRLSSML